MYNMLYIFIQVLLGILVQNFIVRKYSVTYHIKFLRVSVPYIKFFYLWCEESTQLFDLLSSLFVPDTWSVITRLFTRR